MGARNRADFCEAVSKSGGVVGQNLDRATPRPFFIVSENSEPQEAPIRFRSDSCGWYNPHSAGSRSHGGRSVRAANATWVKFLTSLCAPPKMQLPGLLISRWGENGQTPYEL